MRALVLTSVALAALAAATASPAKSPPLVPLSAQHAIKAKRNLLAFVPTVAPTGFRYYRWAFSVGPEAMRVWLRNRAGAEITFIATHQSGSCAAGHEKSFFLDGNKVWWSHTRNEQQAWRCVPSPVNAKPIRLTAATTMPPATFADTGIGRVAASGHWIR
jgi:hypothetical protein